MAPLAIGCVPDISGLCIMGIDFAISFLSGTAVTPDISDRNEVLCHLAGVDQAGSYEIGAVAVIAAIVISIHRNVGQIRERSAKIMSARIGRRIKPLLCIINDGLSRTASAAFPDRIGLAVHIYACLGIIAFVATSAAVLVAGLDIHAVVAACPEVIAAFAGSIAAKLTSPACFIASAAMF